MIVDRKRVIAILDGLLIAQDEAHAKRAIELIKEDYRYADVEVLNGVEGIQAELVPVTPEEMDAMDGIG